MRAYGVTSAGAMLNVIVTRNDERGKRPAQ